ncbi:MAG: response regulator [Proteobacteria bacterium]|nr:response regulator [Pseudomonadota bacterium]MBU1710147.1 response regulator [Pseudomonadota bacterium]
MRKIINILLVDDEADFLEATRKSLLRRGYLVKCAGNCLNASRFLDIGGVDVVVLDVMLPDRDGLLFLKEIKQKWPEIPVIILSGHASMQSGIRGIEFGAYDYCLKPIEVDELVERIEICCRMSPPPAEGLSRPANNL